MKMFSCKNVAFYLICIMFLKFVTPETGRVVQNKEKLTHLRLPRHVELPTESVITYLNHQIGRLFRRRKNRQENNFSIMKDNVHDDVDDMPKKVRHRKEHKAKKLQKRSEEDSFFHRVTSSAIEDVEYGCKTKQCTKHHKARTWAPIEGSKRYDTKEAKTSAHANDEPHKIKKAKKSKVHIHKNQYNSDGITSEIQTRNHRAARHKNKHRAAINGSMHSPFLHEKYNIIEKQKEQSAEENKETQEMIVKSKHDINHTTDNIKDLHPIYESQRKGIDNSEDTEYFSNLMKTRSIRKRLPVEKPTDFDRKIMSPRKYIIED